MPKRKPRFPQARQVSTSVPFCTVRAELKTFHAQQAFARAFDRFANAVYVASVILRVFGEEPDVRELEGMIDERINRLFEDMRNERKRIGAAAEANGVALSAVEYSKPEIVEARISSPRSGRFLGVIREYDSLVVALDAMWLGGAIPDGEYQRTIYEWKRRILRDAGRVSQLTASALRQARQRGVTLHEGGDDGAMQADERRAAPEIPKAVDADLDSAEQPGA